jgi:hypothetical protein
MHMARTALGPERIAAVLVGCSRAVALALGFLASTRDVRHRAAAQAEIALRLALVRGPEGSSAAYSDTAAIAAVGAAAGSPRMDRGALVIYAHPDFHAPALWIGSPVRRSCVHRLYPTIAPAPGRSRSNPMTITREG